MRIGILVLVIIILALGGYFIYKFFNLDFLKIGQEKSLNVFKSKKGVVPEFTQDRKLIPKKAETSMRILTVYDNYQARKDLKSDWGFSCLVFLNGKKILFDTGTSGKILLSNMEKLGVSPQEIDKVIISHDHLDHFGGLDAFLNQNKKVRVYVLSALSQTRGIAQNAGAEIIENDAPSKISEDVFTTGALGTGIKEQSLVLDTEKGLVVITGCAHPGIANIVLSVKNQFSDKNIYLVMGGFHLFQTSEAEVHSIIKSFRDLDVQKVAPCHCTGDSARQLFKEEYGDDFIENGVGKIIAIE